MERGYGTLFIIICVKRTVFERSAYLDQLYYVKYRHILAKLRSSYILNIEIGRQDKKCIRRNLNDIEDEFHFVLVCPDYINLRNA